MSNALPYFNDMTDDEIRSAYIGYRNAAYNWGGIAQSTNPRSNSGRRVASGWGRSIRAVELIEAIANKRRIRLV